MLSCAFPGTDKDRISGEVVDLIREHPQGIPVKRLAVFYSQMYKRNLIVSELGFSSVGAFVDSLPRVRVENENVLLRSPRATPGQSAPLVETPPSLIASPRVTFGASPVLKQDEMTHEKLLENVKEVIKVYPAAAASITQLQNGYFLHFGSRLPLELYMSLYDSQTNTPTATPSRALANAKAEPGASAST